MSPHDALPGASPALASDPPRARALRADLVRALRGDVSDPSVLEAMMRVPRHLFAPELSLERAYADLPASIGYAQTISQPAIVGIMTEALELGPTSRVLEIGTGSGYQAAVLSRLAGQVYTIERIPELAARASAALRTLGCTNVRVRVGDGHDGWPEEAPFDRILGTAAPDEVPATLLDQLAEGGILVIPVGGSGGWTPQRLLRFRKVGGRVLDEDLGGVQFVPMVHDEQTPGTGDAER